MGLRRLRRLRRLARVRRRATRAASAGLEALPSSFNAQDVNCKVQANLDKSRTLGAQSRQNHTKTEQLLARTAVKRALPRYARINVLAPGLSWGHVQRQLQQSGHVFWRPSLHEKRAAACVSAGLQPPEGNKIYYRDVHLPELLVFKPMGQSHTDGELFDEGGLVFQQKASAFPAIALAPPPGAQVIDACAAPGSKTSQLAAMMKNEGQIFAFDRDGRRLKTMIELLQRRHVSCVEACEKDFLQVSPKNAKYQHVTHFLLDPSCSSSGMTAQQLTGDEVATLTANQQKVIRHAMRFPACQRIAYSTCSILDKENELVVQKVLSTAEGARFQLERALPWWPRRGLPVFPGTECCVRSTWEDQTIGFFLALFVRNETACKPAALLFGSLALFSNLLEAR
ncbi:unnamed protein product [Effrenium voratum]|uniref:SAM-dependent MTase RsmB/NOP-type domain-containing protein n=1 Tax=Effrenium voratum TaxID=2562239 RepID=A0AA36HNT3_9DINO|nr:unnamed protein product [Effrenium voratum]CAJ1453975.1 unnamed protein product [Effrenium voratum]